MKCLSVLIVDDNPGDVALITEAYRDACFPATFHVACDGAAALDYLFQREAFRGSAAPDIVLLDLNIPKKNGFEVLSEIRNDPRLQTLPVFVISGSRNAEDISRCAAFNVSDFLEKPSDLAGLNEMVLRLFSYLQPEGQ